MSYDAKCHTLAGYFLRDFAVPEGEINLMQHDLAQAIQDAIEDFVADRNLQAKP